jgi:hypothetical protein
MPLTLTVRIGLDTVAKLERAATRRFAEALRLIDEEPFGAIYLLGYTIEMRLKGAHYRLAGISPAWNISDPIPPNVDSPRTLAERQIKSIRIASSPRSVGHDLLGWAQLVIVSRTAAALPPLAFQAEFLSHTKDAALCWTESLRYHANKPYNEELDAVVKAARWVTRNYRKLWSQFMVAATKKPGMYDLLTKLLRDRLKDDLDRPTLPLVVENRALSGRSIHLLVIWDAWRDLSNIERSSVILDAYALVHGKEPMPAVAIGVTASEAISLGYLPFRIAPLVRKTDGLSLAKLEKVMQKAGGVPVRVGDALDIRFATSAQAANAYRSLQSEVPSPVWTLIEERPAVETA